MNALLLFQMHELTVTDIKLMYEHHLWIDLAKQVNACLCIQIL